MFEYSIFKQSGDVAQEIAIREKKLRKKLNYTQAQLAKKSGISLGSLQRFEQTGEISFQSLLKIAKMLDALADFDMVFKEGGGIDKKIEKLFE